MLIRKNYKAIVIAAFLSFFAIFLARFTFAAEQIGFTKSYDSKEYNLEIAKNTLVEVMAINDEMKRMGEFSLKNANNIQGINVEIANLQKSVDKQTLLNAKQYSLIEEQKDILTVAVKLLAKQQETLDALLLENRKMNALLEARTPLAR